jgi:hypothetical protein
MLLAGRVAGEATGGFVFTFEVDDFAGWGAAYDKFFVDPEGQAMQASLGTSTIPLVGLTYRLWLDVPL